MLAGLRRCDIPGLANVEFSLHHLKGALPIGILSDGVLTITHEGGTTLRISNVAYGTSDINGANPNLKALPGGPYQVWVRWNKPSQSAEEFHQYMKQQIPVLKKKVDDGELTLPPGMLDRLEKIFESGRVITRFQTARRAMSGQTISNQSG